MKIQLQPFAAVLCIAAFIAAPALASAATDTDATQVKRLQVALDNLQQEVTTLKQELKDKGVVKQPLVHKHIHGVALPSQTTGSMDPSTGFNADNRKLTGKELVRLISEEKEYLPFDLDVPGQAFVSTGPYVGVPIQFAGTNLVINSPSVNTDLQLLDIRKSIIHQLTAMGGELFKEPYHSHLLLSGVVESQANYVDVGGAPSTSHVDVTNVSFDAFFIGPSEWTLGFIEFSYAEGPPVGSSYVVSNSRVFVNKAFVTIGDLALSPLYGSFGQFYVPFGRYSSVMVNPPLTQLLTRVKARSILLGISQQGDNAFYGSLYIFKGDSHAASVSKLNNGGINLGYKFHAASNFFRGDFGGGMIGNIADSGGMQIGNGFQYYEQLVHRVPGYNLRGIFSFGEHIDFIGEYVGASTRFNPNDMSFNGHGAKPTAFDMELSYSFMMLDNKPSSLALGYTKTNQALSLGLPLTHTALVLNTSLWRNTLQSLEVAHDRSYAASDKGNGPTGAATSPGACTSLACTSSGKADNVVTAQFDYYF